MAIVAISGLEGVCCGGQRQNVRLERDLIFFDPAQKPGLTLLPGDILACQEVTEQGAHVMAMDQDGAMRVGLVPVRDEWGHLNYRTWLHDTTLEEGTLRVVRGVTALPSRVTIGQGAAAVLVRTNEMGSLISYSRGGQDFLLLAPHDALRLMDTREPAREEQLRVRVGQQVATLKDENEHLVRRVNMAEAILLELQGLLMERNGLVVENRRLAAEVQAGETLLRNAIGDMAKDIPPDGHDAALSELAEWRAQRLQNRSGAELRIASLNSYSEALKSMRLAAIDAEASAVRAEATLEATTSASALEALSADVTDSLGGILALLNARRPIAEDTADLRNRLDAVDTLNEVIARIIDENEMLSQDLAELNERYEALKEQLAEVAPVAMADDVGEDLGDGDAGNK